MRQQAGIALVVALVLLIAVTLVGLAAIRGTTLQEKMAGNMMDHDVALQEAEAALRVGAAAALDSTATQWRDCSVAGVVCSANDVFDNPTAVVWNDVATGTALTQYSAGALAADQPQYAVEYMGLFADPNNTVGNNLSGSSGQYGSGNTGGGSSVPYYRITARSFDPSKSADRSVVVLQAWVRG